jgi:LysR family carnitine catabolism transcriptional activator
MNVTLRQLQAFVLTAQLGGLTRAAERMHVTQSAISVSIKQLEEMLGVRLFDRTTRAVRLTDAGREALGAAELIMRTHDVMVANLRGLTERSRGHVKFAATPALAAGQMPQVLAAFRNQYPGVKATMLDVAPDLLVEKVLEEEAEFAIGTVDGSDDRVVLETLIRDEFCAVCRKDSHIARLDSLAWAAMPNFPIVAITKNSSIRSTIDDVFRRIGVELVPDYEASLLTTILALVEQGLGVSILPRHLIARLHFPGLTTRTLTDPNIIRELSIITKPRRTLSCAAQSFLEIARRTIVRDLTKA